MGLTLAIQLLLISLFLLFVFGATDSTCNLEPSLANLFGYLNDYTAKTNVILNELRGKYFSPHAISLADVHAVILAAFAFGFGLGGGQALFSKRKAIKISGKEPMVSELGQNSSAAVTIFLPVKPQSSQ